MCSIFTFARRMRLALRLRTAPHCRLALSPCGGWRAALVTVFTCLANLMEG